MFHSALEVKRRFDSLLIDSHRQCCGSENWQNFKFTSSVHTLVVVISGSRHSRNLPNMVTVLDFKASIWGMIKPLLLSKLTWNYNFFLPFLMFNKYYLKINTEYYGLI